MLSCVLVDIVPVSTEQPIGVDQEQLFEEEEDQFLVEEGKWSSSPACSILSYFHSMIIKFTFMLSHNFDENTFLRTYLVFLS